MSLIQQPPMRHRCFLPSLFLALSSLASGLWAAPPPDDAVTKLARSSNALGFDLYQRLRETPGNLVMSPASVTMALAMAWGGARGETALQMRQVLHLEGTADEAMITSGQLARSLQDPSRPIVFRIANRLFGEKTFRLDPAFLSKTRAAFDAPVELLDFKKTPERARVQINRWVEDRTERRITGLIPPGGVVPATRLVIVNAIYFLGDWAYPFSPDGTLPAPFHLTTSRTTDVATMNRIGGFRIARKDGVTALEIAYKGGELSMMLLVPDEIEGLAAIESTLDTKKLGGFASAMKSERVWLSLPKFEVNPGGSLPLGDHLRALGMPIAFDRGRADFTGIADPPDPDERLFIADVFHKGFVRVDEKGTEAAAATAMGVVAGASPYDEPLRRLKVDRPFLFLIRDNASGLVLFLGRVSDPGRP